MLWVYGRFTYFNPYSVGIDFRRQNLWTSDYRRQILTSKDGPRTERVKKPYYTALIMKEKHSLIQLLAIINACGGTHIIKYL